jgi:plastocyanin
MTLRVLLGVSVSLALIAALGGADRATAGQAAGSRGTIKGRVRLSGKAPGNVVIRMGMDPMCAKINAGKQVIQPVVVTSDDGGLANVFVKLQGTFPQTPVPTDPVTLDQRGCMYAPRVVGVRVGQTLQVRNSDDFLHNVHGMSGAGNGFNVSEPKAGMVQQFPLKNEETMLTLKCDVHRWMMAFVGVVSHPYFAVTGETGSFEIRNVPAGMQTIKTWHERYGELSQTVRVTGGGTATADFAYTGTERPATGR